MLLSHSELLPCEGLIDHPFDILLSHQQMRPKDVIRRYTFTIEMGRFRFGMEEYALDFVLYWR